MRIKIFLALIVLLGSNLWIYGQRTPEVKQEKLKRFGFWIHHGKKGTDRFDIWKKYERYMAVGDYPGVIDFLNEELIKHDTSGDEYIRHTAGLIYGMRGSANIPLKQYVMALDDLDTAIHLNPKWSYGYHLKGLICLELYNYVGASEYFQKAIDLPHKRDEKYYYYSKGKADFMLNRYAAAEKDFTKVIKKDPFSVDGYYFRAETRENLHDLKGAEKDFKKVIRFGPRHCASYPALSDFYLRNGDTAKAISTAKKAIRKVPEDLWRYRNLGNYYLLIGEKDSADHYFNKCYENAKSNFPLLINISMIYYDYGDMINAKKFLDQAIVFEPQLSLGMEGIAELEKEGRCYYNDEMKKKLSRMFEELQSK